MHNGTSVLQCHVPIERKYHPLLRISVKVNQYANPHLTTSHCLCHEDICYPCLSAASTDSEILSRKTQAGLRLRLSCGGAELFLASFSCQSSAMSISKLLR